MEISGWSYCLFLSLALALCVNSSGQRSGSITWAMAEINNAVSDKLNRQLLYNKTTSQSAQDNNLSSMKTAVSLSVQKLTINNSTSEDIDDHNWYRRRQTSTVQLKANIKKVLFHHRLLFPINTLQQENDTDSMDNSEGSMKHTEAQCLPAEISSLLTDWWELSFVLQVFSALADGRWLGWGGCVLITECGDSRMAEHIQSTTVRVWCNDRWRGKKKHTKPSQATVTPGFIIPS